MKTVLAEIQALERKIAETYESYKKKHPGSKKTRNDPLFQPANLETHDSMMSNAKSFGLNEPISNYEWAKLKNESQGLKNPDFKALLKKVRKKKQSSKEDLNRKKASRQEMSADDLIGFAKQFVNCGSSVQEQLVDLMEGRYDDINPNAVKVMKQKLSGYHDEIDDVIERALRRSEEE